MTQSNISRFESDLKQLKKKGELLNLIMYRDSMPEHFAKKYSNLSKSDLNKLPVFYEEYQSWYSESLVVIKQIVPDRVDDFIAYYKKPKSRKRVDYESYRVEDYLHNLRNGYVSPSAAIPHFEQQIAILNAVSARFKSSLFDISQIVQADLFDTELDSARGLLKKGFIRASGAIAGVVLEKHLAQVLLNHNIKMGKKNPSISILNDALKDGDVLEVVDWRQIQRLGDIRNLCDHSKEKEPTKVQVEELIDGVDKFLKTIS